MAAILTEAEAARVCTEYAQGATLKELAERYYCNHMTIRRCILKRGGVMRSRGARKQPNIPMIMHDWNAGKDTERMAMVYNYSCERSLLSSIGYYRKKGYNFKTRMAGRKKKHGNQDTASNRPGNNTERICDNGHGDVQATGFRQAAE